MAGVQVVPPRGPGVELKGIPSAQAEGTLARIVARRTNVRVWTGGAGQEVPPPDLILFFVTHPDDFRIDQATEWMRRIPGVRLLVVGNAWNESTIRSRHLAAAGLWVAEESLGTRLELELDAFEGKSPPLPATADRSEIFAAQSQSAASLPPCRIDVRSPDPEFEAFCRDELIRLGGTIFVRGEDRQTHPDALLVDVDPVSGEPGPAGDGWRSSCPCPSPAVLLSSTPWRVSAGPFPAAGLPGPYRVLSKHSGSDEWCRALGELLGWDGFSR